MIKIRHGAMAAVVLALGVQAAAVAQQAPAVPTVPPAPAAPALSAPAPSAPAEPPPAPEISASQMEVARDVVKSSGMSRSFAPMIPELTEQIGPMLTRTRPEMAKDLAEVLKQLQPEFAKKSDDMLDIAARIYARRMSEDELKQTAAFFNGPIGKKYVASQPAMLDELVLAMQSWTQEISTFMMTRVRQEMIKKGHPF